MGSRSSIFKRAVVSLVAVMTLAILIVVRDNGVGIEENILIKLEKKESTLFLPVLLDDEVEET